ncbi:caspase family protein [Rivibacter subsaxonicus]|uniref:Caspase domain-containing protein n=1 Tax=Rivibacter subsaxonicus TaxID=457575 RepID=A0A4V2FSB8_9BURK|nr:caspase family protein [Rivibacter subsaxonicus]RZT93709.1 caspase domain-containing protein [Rivibacter subsaxonicus]
MATAKKAAKKAARKTEAAMSKGAARKRRGIGLHIGLNTVSASHYGGWSGPLQACEFDANDMAALAAERGMSSSVLLTKKATRSAVLDAIRAAAKQLHGGDFFFLSYSGHGGQVPDVSGEERDDKLDETWCLYDGQLIDDELYLELASFITGVKVLVLSDSCHSGSVVRAGPPQAGVTPPEMRSKAMPAAVALRTYRDNRRFYDKLQEGVAAASEKAGIVDPDAALAAVAATSARLTKIARRMKPRVILISGCQDNQSSYDGDHNGAFTERMLTVWNNGGFSGNYAQFHATIKAGMPAVQTPNLFTMGTASKFLLEPPFSF